jgi:hypothetical protein
MRANPDFKDLFSIFNAEQVEYLVVGAYAVMYYAEPRFTKDLDIWINPTEENAKRAWAALSRFGAPLSGVQVDDFINPDLVYQIGVEPNRIDILMGIAGVSFKEAFPGSESSTYAGVPIKIIGKTDLIRAKKATGRKQDLLDLDRLEEDQ